MDNLIFQERKSKIEILQNNLNKINAEIKVRKPQPSIKTLFNGKHPQNRKNLKKLDIILSEVKTNGEKKTLPRPPSILSLITNSKTDEFLSLDKPKYFNAHKTLPLTVFSSSSTLYSINKNHNQNLFNGNHIYNNNFDNNINNTNMDLPLLNTSSSLPLIRVKKESNMSKQSNGINEIKKEKDLKELYQEYIDNVS